MKGQPQHQQLSPMFLLPQNSKHLKVLSCFILFGLGSAFGTFFSSYIATIPLVSLQTLQFPFPSPPNSSSLLLPSSPPMLPSSPSKSLLPSSPPNSSSSSLLLPSSPPNSSSSSLSLPSSPPNSSPPLLLPSSPPNSSSALLLPSSPPTHIPSISSSPSPPPPPPPPPPRTLPSLPPPQKISRSGDVEPKNLMHHMDDGNLLRRASMVPRTVEHGVPKVAFMFLARGVLPFAPLWDKFFKGYQGLFSIYLHLSPDYNGTVPENSVFYGRRIPSKRVQWGQVNMMEAERRLLANALLDLSNQRFILLSEACVPLFNFSTVYSYLINSNLSYIKVYDDPGQTGRGRYSRRMLPNITIKQWRKGSQWFECDRALAVDIVSDTDYFPIFRKHCKGGCYVDEHYLPTLMNIRYGHRNSNRSLTWVNWSVVGAHPARYYRKQVTPELLTWMRDGTTCTYNGKVTNICFLFARKFLPDALIRFQLYAPRILGFG